MVLDMLLFIQLFHEEIAVQWTNINTNGNNSTKKMVLDNSWFFFEMLVSYKHLSDSPIANIIMNLCFRSKVWLSTFNAIANFNHLAGIASL